MDKLDFVKFAKPIKYTHLLQGQMDTIHVCSITNTVLEETGHINT